MSQGGYRLNDARVIFESFDAEILAVNLDAGIYYSISGTGAEIWTWLLAGVDRDGVLAACRARYTGDPAAIDDAVGQFIDKLAAEHLIVADDRAGTAPPPPDGAAGERAFVMPALDVYTDMQDLLILDPIHDVDERGWPVHPAPADRSQ